MNDLKKYCYLLKCPHEKDDTCKAENIPLDKDCCHTNHLCEFMPVGYKDTFWFFIWKKELEEEIKNEN